MLSLNFHDVAVPKNLDPVVKKCKKKLERELLDFHNISMVFNVYQRTKKSVVIHSYIQQGDHKLHEQEFASRNVEGALEQVIQDAIWAVKQRPMYPEPPRHSMMPL